LDAEQTVPCTAVHHHPATHTLHLSTCTAGVQAGTQCWGGNDLVYAQALGEVVDEATCGPANIAIYAFTLPSAYEGCYGDAEAARALPALLGGYNDPGMTPALCALRAAAAGYKLFGLQDGGQCWAGAGCACWAPVCRSP
jgi:hypothetical protein